jgi:hypothetical protein
MIITSIQQFSKNNIIHYTVFTNDGLHVITESDRNIFDTIVGENGETQQINPNQPLFDAIDLYISNGGTVIDLAGSIDLKNLKIQKKTQLELSFNNSKFIRILGATISIDIKHDTPQREQFLKLIEIVGKEESSNSAVLTYYQTEADKVYDITFVPYIWKYIYTKLFLTQRPSGFWESLRYLNRRKYDECFLKIENATTLEAINAIDFQFISPNGIVIDINQNAHDMLNDVEVPQRIKDLITPFLDENGNVTKIINVKYL